jgi:hypothetical protein
VMQPNSPLTLRGRRGVSHTSTRVSGSVEAPSGVFGES